MRKGTTHSYYCAAYFSIGLFYIHGLEVYVGQILTVMMTNSGTTLRLSYKFGTHHRHTKRTRKIKDLADVFKTVRKGTRWQKRRVQTRGRKQLLFKAMAPFAHGSSCGHSHLVRQQLMMRLARATAAASSQCSRALAMHILRRALSTSSFYLFIF